MGLVYHALKRFLMNRNSDDKEKEWYTNDVETQRLVVRSISAFLDGVSPDAWQMSIVKVPMYGILAILVRVVYLFMAENTLLIYE